jgi:hypothetical protein
MSATQVGGNVMTPQQQGRAIFEAADAHNSGYVDLEVELQMILRSPSGAASQRSLRISQFEVPEDGDKMLVVFETPADIRGTALLSHAHKAKEDDQWLFLPAIKRVKKVSSHNKSGSFVGSEFSYQDLSPPQLDKYTYEFIREDALDGVPCFIVKRVSTETNYQYAEEHFWIDQEAYRVHRVDYFDHTGSPVKQLRALEFELYDERFWKARRMLMTNLRNNRSTELVWHDFEFNVGLDGTRDFSVNSLRRAR